MTQLIPVEGDPFAAAIGPRLVPVEGDPFSTEPNPAGPGAAPAPVQLKTASAAAMPAGIGEFLEKAGTQLAPENDPTVRAFKGMVKESTEQMSKGVEQIKGGEPWKGALNTALGALGYTLAPINAPIRSLVGQPVQDATGIPKEHTEFAAQLLIPGIGLTKILGRTPAGEPILSIAGMAEVPGVTKGAAPAAAATAAKPAGEAVAAPVPEGAPLKTVLDDVKVAVEKATPTTENLKTLSQRLYKVADENDVVITSEAGQKIIAEAFKRITRRIPGENSGGFSPSVQKESFGALKELYETVTSGPQVALQSIEDKRSILAEVARSADKRERRVAGMIIEELEKGLSKLKAGDVTGGDVAQVKDLLETRAVARELWDRHLKSETLDKLWRSIELTKGKFSGSGLENAIRTKFRQLAQNEEEMRRFAPAEREAIEGLTTAKGAAYLAQLAGKLTPVSFMGLMSAIGAVTVKGPVGLALPAIGLTGRAVANALTKSEVQKLRELVRSGGKRAAEEAPAAESAMELPMRTLLQAGSAVSRGVPAEAD